MRSSTQSLLILPALFALVFMGINTYPTRREKTVDQLQAVYEAYKRKGGGEVLKEKTDRGHDFILCKNFFKIFQQVPNHTCVCKMRWRYFSLTSHLSHVTLGSKDNCLQSIISFGNLIADRGINIQGTFATICF